MSVAAAATARHWWGRRPESRFPLRFLLLLLGAIGFSLALAPAWDLLSEATARLVAWTANLLGLGAEVLPDRVVSFGGGTFRYTIIGECTAITLLLIYAAAVLAYPATRRQRAIGFLVGVPVLFALNLVRLLTLAWVGLEAPQHFEAVHIFWWQGFLILFTGLGWFAWARFVVHTGARSRPGSARARELGVGLLVFLGALSAFAVVGIVGGVEIYGRVLKAFQWPIASVFWRIDIQQPPAGSLFDLFVWDYAILAAVLALFLATPRVRGRRRVRGALLVGLPVVLVLQILSFVVSFRANLRPIAGADMQVLGPYGASAVGTVLLVLRVGVPAACWLAWARRDFGRAFASGERNEAARMVPKTSHH